MHLLCISKPKNNKESSKGLQQNTKLILQQMYNHKLSKDKKQKVTAVMWAKTVMYYVKFVVLRRTLLQFSIFVVIPMYSVLFYGCLSGWFICLLMDIK